jgi:hypothetical protein
MKNFYTLKQIRKLVSQKMGYWEFGQYGDETVRDAFEKLNKFSIQDFPIMNIFTLKQI